MRPKIITYGREFSVTLAMKDKFNNLLAVLFGDARHYSLEHRLFNTIALLNALANAGGFLGQLLFDHDMWLLLLHLVTAIAFAGFYVLARRKHIYRLLYWPFVGLMLAFLFYNALGNAGSLGGAHYYFIPALMIAVMLSESWWRTVAVSALFTLVVAAFLLLEKATPEIIKPYPNSAARFPDIFGNLLFVQLFAGLLVLVLAKNLHQERNKSDRLLRNILPESVAEELKRQDRVEPQEYSRASVLFTDFVGFTNIAETLTPQQLVSELSQSFAAFDVIAKTYGLEKIKTIGDAYMAVGGIPQANRTHAIDCVQAGLALCDYLAELREARLASDKPAWQLRVGINTGPLVAGVIGTEKFAYDVWGDTVNTASRLESSGAAGRVNISVATYEAVKDFFVCEYRGLVQAKSKGVIEMYFALGLRPELSANADGRTPNDAFRQRYQQVLNAEC